MKIPINKLTKLLKPMTQWSTPMTVTFCLYILFILVVFSISFPLKSHKISKLAAMGMNRENILMNDNEANRFGEIEQKFLLRAHDLPATNNRSDILRDAFQRWVGWVNAQRTEKVLVQYIRFERVMWTLYIGKKLTL